MFGELSAIDEKPRSATVVALSDTLIVRLPATKFWEILQRHPQVCAIALRNLTDLIRLLCERVVEFSTLGAANRLMV